MVSYHKTKVHNLLVMCKFSDNYFHIKQNFLFFTPCWIWPIFALMVTELYLRQHSVSERHDFYKPSANKQPKRQNKGSEALAHVKINVYLRSVKTSFRGTNATDPCRLFSYLRHSKRIQAAPCRVCGNAPEVLRKEPRQHVAQPCRIRQR